MDEGDWIAIVAAGIALLALWFSHRANKHAAESNRLSSEANQEAKKANEASDALLKIEDWRHQIELDEWEEAAEKKDAIEAEARFRNALANRAELRLRLDKAESPSEPAKVVIDNNGPGEARNLLIKVESETGQPILQAADSMLQPKLLPARKEHHIPIDEREIAVFVTVEWSDAREGRHTNGPRSYYTGPGEDPALKNFDVFSLFSRQRR